MGTANADAVKELKQLLALAERGDITNVVVVATGERLYHRTFSIPKPEDMPMMIGEVGMFQREMELIVLGNRTEQQQDRAAGIVGRPRFQM